MWKEFFFVWIYNVYAPVEYDARLKVVAIWHKNDEVAALTRMINCTWLLLLINTHQLMLLEVQQFIKI